MHDRMKSSKKLIATAATLIVAATGTIGASAPDGGTTEAGARSELTVTAAVAKSSDFTADFKTEAVTPQAAGKPAGYCKQPNPMTTAVNRTMDCYHMDIKVDVKRNGRLVGSASFTSWHEIHLNLKKVKWSEKITVSKATIVGDARGISTSFHPSCRSGCQVRAAWQPRPPLHPRCRPHRFGGPHLHRQQGAPALQQHPLRVQLQEAGLQQR